jgi:hypothetical protein
MLFITANVFKWIRKNVGHIDFDKQQAVVFYHESKMIYLTTAKDAPSYFELVKAELAINKHVTYTMEDMEAAFDDTLKNKDACNNRALTIDERTAHTWRVAESMVYLLLNGTLVKQSPPPNSQIIHFYKTSTGQVRSDYLIR